MARLQSRVDRLYELDGDHRLQAGAAVMMDVYLLSEGLYQLLWELREILELKAKPDHLQTSAKPEASR